MPPYSSIIRGTTFSHWDMSDISPYFEALSEYGLETESDFNISLDYLAGLPVS
mgnify:CR=1 FL=1